MELPVKNTKGEVVGSVELSEKVFGVPMNTAVVHQALLAQLANRRRGTHDTKTRAEVSGGGRKPWRQKGTGRARQGSIRSPQWRHGGIVFGPHPRDYSQRIPKKMRRQAIRCLFSQRTREGAITVVERLDLPSKTSEIKKLLTLLEINKKCLILTGEPDRKVFLASRNLPGVKAVPVAVANVVDLLDHDHLVMTADAVRRVEELWGQERPRRKVKAMAAE